MFSSTSVRSAARRRGRLVAACTAGVLAAGAFALGPAGTAFADNGTAPHAVQLTAPQTPQSTTVLRKHQVRASATSTGATALKTPRYDYDGDGYSDLLVEHVDHTVSVLSSAFIIGGGKGTTALGSAGLMYRDLLTPGKLTSDGSNAQVLALTPSGQLRLFSSANDLVSGYNTWAGNGWLIYNQLVAVGDIDGNGYGDLLARTPSGDLYLYKGTGRSTSPFASRMKVGVGFGIYDQLVGAGDTTGTGYETLMARDLTGTLWMYKLDGTAATPVKPRVKIGSGWNTYSQLVGWGDDKGSTGQLMGRAANGTLYWYTGAANGTAALTPRETFGSGWTAAIVSGQGHTPVWGKDTLFGVSSGGNLYYYYSYNTGVLTPRKQLGDTGGWGGAKLFSPVSLTEEGYTPLLELYNGSMYDDSNYNTFISGGWGSYNKVFGPGDLSDDGNTDLLARDGSGVLWLVPGRGNTSFGPRVRVGSGWGAYNQLTGAGDINGDGFADIVARAGNGHLYLYLGTGSSRTPFRSRVDVGPGWNTYTKLASPGDMDGDGRADLVGVTSGGRLYRYSGSGHTGTSTFKSRVEIGTAGWNSYTSLF